MELLNCSVKRNVERIKSCVRYQQSHARSRFPRSFHAKEKGTWKGDSFHFLYLHVHVFICILATKIKAVKSFPPLKVWNFAMYGHVHVLISMMLHFRINEDTC